MTEQRALLIELGTEELPVAALPVLAKALLDGVLAALRKRGIDVDARDARPLYTPRRLAVLLQSVAMTQPQQASEVLGPYLNIALDAEGQPTRALQGFAAKAGVEWSALERASDAKGERFVHRAVTPGARTVELLPEILREAVAGMPIPKPMRWGDHDHAFARPVHWLVMLLGSDVVDAEILGVRSDRMSRGHRFEHPKPVWIGSPDDYVDALRAAHVLVDPDERRARIQQQAQDAATAVGGDARITADTLEQVNCLVEWPSAVSCTFDGTFLEVPQEALVATMETNQKFFPVLDEAGRLTAHFIGIANIESHDVAEVRKGYERVIRPRFADAKFFFDEDLKQGLVAMGDGLAAVTYQAKLGSVADKVRRVAALAQAIAVQDGVDPVLAKRAAQLSKCDLQSRMVGEFPELQGIAGRHYMMVAADPESLAMSADDRRAVALAIDEAYQPRFAGDDIAPSPVGRVLAIAERVDTLAGGFAAGLRPTGNKDAFALRRNALGLARTLIEGHVDLDLKALIDTALELLPEAVQPHADRNTETLGVDLYGFILERLRGYYIDKGVPAQHFTAVAELEPNSLLDFDTRLDAIGKFAALPGAEALAAANKRIRNIIRKADVAIPEDLDRGLLQEPAECALADAVEAAIVESDAALAAHDYIAVLSRLASVRPQVDAFFDAVMVNAEDPALRANRLALLKRLADRFGAVAAIEHLSG